MVVVGNAGLYIFSLFKAQELANTQASLQQSLNDIEAKESEMSNLHAELDSANRKAQEKDSELHRVLDDNQQLQSQLLVKSEINEHDDEGEENEGDDNKEFGE